MPEQDNLYKKFSFAISNFSKNQLQIRCKKIKDESICITHIFSTNKLKKYCNNNKKITKTELI